MGWTWGWSAVAAIATVILAIGVFVGFWRAKKQLEAARKSTNAQIAVELFRVLRSAESKKTLGLIYKLSPEDVTYLPRGTDKYLKYKNEINNLLDKFEMLGSLVNHGIIDKSLAIEAYGGPPALRCWYKLVDYIREETSKRGYFLQNYEAFARVCLDYFDDRHIEVNFYEEAEDGKILSIVNLIDLLKLDISCSPRSLKEIKRDRKKDKRND